MRYRPEIDGLRALAVLPVILFHANMPGFSGGYVGVDVFFVISGYLITTIILEDHEAGGFSISKFYERRSRRLLPALFVVMAACLIPAWVWLLPSDFEAFAHSLAFVSLFASNFYFADNTGYFDAPTDELPLLHTWSLAVEEQFYIIFPFLLLALWHAPPKMRITLLVALFLLSLGWAEVSSRSRPDAAFFLLPSRFWELLAGGGCAIWLRDRAPHNQTLLASVGVLLLAGAFTLFTPETRHPSLLTILPVGGTCLIILFAGSATSTAKLLALPPLLGIGLISYSAYLWHQPLFAFARVQSLDEPPLSLMLALAVASLGLAGLTWAYVERPFRRKRQPFLATRRSVFAASGAGIFAFLLLGGIGELNDGFASRYKGLQLANYQMDNRILQQASWKPLSELSGVPDYRKEGRVFDSTSWFAADDPRRGLIVTGDSHSKDLYNTLSSSKAATSAFKIARYGARPAELADPNHEFYATPNFRDADTILIAPRYHETDMNQIGPAIETLKAKGKTAVIVLNTPEFSGDLTTSLADAIIIHRLRSGNQQNPKVLAQEVNATYTSDLAKHDRKQALNDRLRKFGQSQDVIVLDRRRYICPDTCRVISEELDKYIYDYGHLTIEGAAFYGSLIDATGWLEPLLAVR